LLLSRDVHISRRRNRRGERQRTCAPPEDFSSTRTRCPAIPSVYAQAKPAMPAPVPLLARSPGGDHVERAQRTTSYDDEVKSKHLFPAYRRQVLVIDVLGRIGVPVSCYVSVAVRSRAVPVRMWGCWVWGWRKRRRVSILC